MSGDIILVIVIATALAFDFTNGFHDTANVVATAISTRAIAPKPAVAMAAMLNFVGAFLSLQVAATVGKGFVDTNAVTTTVVFAGLVGAIAWNVITWYFGLPSSSSHALIGGLVGAVTVGAGVAAVNGDGLLSNLIVPAIIAPPIAFLVAGMSILVIYRIVGNLNPGPVGHGFRLGQLASSGLLSLSHGTNDAQKTMGVIALALVAHGDISANHFYVPDWVVIASASAIALGTFVGGWRIIKTLGTRIIEMDVAQGFAAQAAGAAVILAASSAGSPPSDGESPATSWAPGRSPSRPPRSWAEPSTRSPPYSGTGQPDPSSSALSCCSRLPLSSSDASNKRPPRQSRHDHRRH
jgi:inorganic phosphate transporter, PiT family